MKGWFLGGLVLALGLCATRVHAQPRHSGFTGDLGLGISLMMVPVHTVTICGGSSPGCVGGESISHESHVGLAPLSLTLGGFVSRNVALAARVAGTSYFLSNGDQVAHSFYGAIVEGWPNDFFYLSGGIGLTLFGKNAFLNPNAHQEGGWALDLRAGLALAQGTNHDFTLSLEAIPGFYDDELVNAFALVGAWKWY